MMLAALVAALAVSAGTDGAAVPLAAAAQAAPATPTPTASAAATPTANDPDAEETGEADPGETDAPAGAPDETSSLPAAPPGPALADTGPVLLSRVPRPGGHAVERLVEPSGDVVEHEVNAAGTVQSCRKVGSLLALRIVAQQPAARGEYLEVARDPSGALVQFVVGSDGDPRAVTLLAPPP